MKHSVSKQQLLLYTVDELSDAERVKLERHLKRCGSCRKEVADLQVMHALVGKHEPSASQATLTAWRRDVIRTVGGRKASRRSVVDILRDIVGFAEGPVLKPALAFVAVGCLAFVIGFSVSGGDATQRSLFAPIAYDPYGSPEVESGGLNEAQVISVDIISKDDRTGDIEFEFEATFRSRISGNMADPDIQNILARALISSQNPGVRLRAVNAFSNTMPERQFHDKSREVIKTSLISAVKYDENRGVRLEALKALKEYLPDSSAADAIVYVLTHDKNAAMKIAAINSLDLTQVTDMRERDQLSEILKDRSLNDDNNYIRIRAKAALQEVYR